MVLPVYETFFEGKVVMAREHAIEALQQRDDRFLDEMRRVVDSGFARLTDAHSKHVIDRISSFPSEKRLAHLSGYVMGLPADLVASFNRAEFEAFTKHSINATHGMIHTVITATARLAHEHAAEFRQRVQPKNRSISLVFLQVLTFSMNACVTGMLMGTRTLVRELEAFAHFNLRERFEYCAGENWASFQRCLAGYDPKKHARGSDEELRFLMAVNGLEGAKSKEEYQQRVLAALDLHRSEIDSIYDKFMLLVPEEILVITDTVSAFEKKALGDHMAETISLLERLRGEKSWE